MTSPEAERRAVLALEHPLVKGRNGFREYENMKEWSCTICKAVIPAGAGYWGTRRRFSGSRSYAKICHACFHTILRALDENPNLRRLLARAVAGDVPQRVRPPSFAPSRAGSAGLGRLSMEYGERRAHALEMEEERAWGRGARDSGGGGGGGGARPP